jgi:uncharacterized protein (TIGR02246 family)
MVIVKSCALVLAAAAFMLGCAQPQPAAPAIDLAAEAQAIRDRSAEWVTLVKARDADGIASLYTTDTVTMVDGALSHGAAEIRAAWAAEFAEHPESTVSSTLTPTHVHVAASGDLGYELGTFNWDGDGAGEAAPITGEYVTVWVKSDGVWRAAAAASTTIKTAKAEAT